MRRDSNPTGLRPLLGLFLVVALVAVLSVPALAINKKETQKRLQNSTEVLKEIVNIPEEGIPDWMLHKCEALVIIPHVVKGAFFVGGEHGNGILIHRLADGRWSSPSFVSISGGSVGFQFGAQAADIVLVVNNQQGYNALLQDNFKFGGDASVAAGPVGRNAEANTDAQLKAAIYSYSRTKGAFAGISLEGAALTIDNDANTAFYGETINARKLLNDPNRTLMQVDRSLAEVLKPYTGRKTYMEADQPHKKEMKKNKKW